MLLKIPIHSQLTVAWVFPSNNPPGCSLTPALCPLTLEHCTDWELRLVHRSKSSMGFATYVSGEEISMGVSSLRYCFGYHSTPQMSFGARTEWDACDILAGPPTDSGFWMFALKFKRQIWFWCLRVYRRIHFEHWFKGNTVDLTKCN